MMVDLFHSQKHMEKTCMPPTNLECKYHPKVPKFSLVHGVNTECAEQAFKWLGNFKHITRKMTRACFCLFWWKWSMITITRLNVHRKYPIEDTLNIYCTCSHACDSEDQGNLWTTQLKLTNKPKFKP